MKKTILKVLAMAMCLCMIAGAFAACAKDEETNGEGESDKGSIVIGLSGPFTGAAAVYGEAVRNSATMAVEEINAAGGLDGITFELVALDDKNDSTIATSNYATLVDKGMQVSLGCVTTTPALEFAELTAEDNVFFLTPSASADAVVEAGDNGYQMCFADNNQGAVAANYVKNDLKPEKVGAFYKVDEAYSKGIYDKFMETLGDDVAVVSTSFSGDDTDFTTQIQTLADAGCDFIFMPIYYTPAISFIVQAKGKIADDATYYGCDGFDGIKGAFPAETPIGTIPQKITMLSHFDSGATEGKAGEFIKKYVAKYGEDTLNQFGASAYDCVYAIYGAMKAAMDDGKEITSDITASDLCDILVEQFNGGYTYSGNTGDDIKWQSSGLVDKKAISYVVKEVGVEA